MRADDTVTLADCISEFLKKHRTPGDPEHYPLPDGCSSPDSSFCLIPGHSPFT